VCLLLIIISIANYSCSNSLKQNVEKGYFPSGNIEYEKIYSKKNVLKEAKYYYDTIGKKIKKKYHRKKEYDSVFLYYKNGIVYEEGKQKNNGLKYGNWNRYTIDSFLSDTREYFIIKNESILNRKFYYNKQEDTVWYAKKFNRYNQEEFLKDTLNYRNSTMNLFDFYHSDTIFINEPFTASIRCNSPLAREYNSEIMMLLAKETANFNENFSNESEVKLDTFYSLNIDETNRVNFPDANFNYVAVFGRWFKSPGEKLLRGYMREYFERNPTENDSIVRGERRVYFEKKIFVKDTLPARPPLDEV